MTDQPLRMPSATLQEVGRRLRDWRLFRGHTQSEVATAVGVTQASISNYERGLRDVSVSTLLGVAEFLRVAPGELLGAAPPEVPGVAKPRQRASRSVLTRGQLVAALTDFVSHWAGNAAARGFEESPPATLQPATQPRTLNAQALTLGHTESPALAIQRNRPSRR